MSLKRRILSRRKLTMSIAAGAAAIAIAIGAFAIAGSGSSSAANTASNTATVGKVIPFDRGNPSPPKQVGQVPPSYKAGTGEIVTGTAADKAKAAVLAAYPGVNVNRVVLLSDGQYNVHIIGVNWPHHVFVSQDFKVIGAE